MRKVKIALLIALLPPFIPRIRHFFVTAIPIDFGVYYTAAVLAHEHQGISIYSGADTGKDPERALAAPNTVFGQTASRLGVSQPLLYVYPPILADMLVPLTLFPLATAFKIWTIINYGLLLLVSALITKLLRLQWWSWGSLIIFIALFSYPPVLLAIIYGQVVILLLLLWTCGIFFYMKGWHYASGLAFALATAIKLTPLIAIVPLLVWKEWKALRGFIASSLFLVVVICLINTPSSLTDYFFHVMPAMSRGLIFIENLSLSSSVERVYAALHHEPISGGVSPYLPAGVIVIGKACALAILVTAGLLTYRNRRSITSGDRVMTLALFAMLSVCVSPVSWVHGYSICFIALSLLWAEALREGLSDGGLVMLLACTLLLNSYLSRFSWALAVKGAPSVLCSILLLLMPLAATVLPLRRLAVLRKDVGKGLVNNLIG